MPLYEFHCNNCDKVFEYLILSNKDKPQCPICKTRNITKQFSVFGFTSGGRTVTSSSNSSCSTCSSTNCSTCG